MPRVHAGGVKDCVRASIGGERPRRVGIGKLRERRAKFGFVHVKSSPGISIKMIHDRPGMQELPDPRQIFSRDAEDHIEELVQPERLPHQGPHRHIPGFFLRIANGNRFRQGHRGRINGKRVECRYERKVIAGF